MPFRNQNLTKQNALSVSWSGFCHAIFPLSPLLSRCFIPFHWWVCSESPAWSDDLVPTLKVKRQLKSLSWFLIDLIQSRELQKFPVGGWCDIFPLHPSFLSATDPILTWLNFTAAGAFLSCLSFWRLQGSNAEIGRSLRESYQVFIDHTTKSSWLLRFSFHKGAKACGPFFEGQTSFNPILISLFFYV